MRPLLVAALLLASWTPAAFAAQHRYVPGEVLVIRRAGGALDALPGGALRARSGRLASIVAGRRIARWEPVGRDGGENPAWIKLVSDDPAFDPVAAARELVASGDAIAASPNVLLQPSITLPNDPYLGTFQYWVDDPGDADIQLANAWDVTHGDTSVTIGIMDTGVDRTHPDLAGHIWRNPQEIAGNGIDDDGDGYIDDVNGWDFGDGDADPNPGPVFDAESNVDVGFHGTFVAGLAAAATDNNEGIAGAAWRCRIVPLKVANAAGDMTLDASAAAFRYAWKQHVSVLNMSLGTPDTLARAYFQALVDSASDRGVVCVSAAGNSGTNAPSFPAACARVLSVGASDETNAAASFSNWGPTVDVAAPGSGMWSAICQNYAVDEYSQVFYLFLFGWDGQDPYMAGDGTSFACPLASGVCALVRSRWPWLSADQVIQRVVSTGDVVAYDPQIGRKLNAYRAVSAPLLDVSGVEAGIDARAWPNPFRASTTVAFELARAGLVRIDVFDAAGRRVRCLAEGTLDAGVHRVRWDGADDAGASSPTGLYFARVEGAGVARALRIVRVE